MSWLASIVIGLIAAAAGAVGAGWVASKCVEWYAISSREGASGYFILFIGMLGAIAGLCLGTGIGRWQTGEGPEVAMRAIGLTLGAIGVLIVAALGICRGIADIPPQIDDRPVDLLIEFRSPEGDPMPTDPNSLEIGLDSMNWRTKRVRHSAKGVIVRNTLRQQEDRWYVVGRAPVETSRGKRIARLTVKGESQAFLIPDSSAEREREWSEWLPRPLPDGSKPFFPMTYRFKRVPRS